MGLKDGGYSPDVGNRERGFYGKMRFILDLSVIDDDDDIQYIS